MKNSLPVLLFLLACAFIINCTKEKSCKECISTNRPPVANAGVYQIIWLPADSVLLDGSSSVDPDNNITGYLWRKIAGPPSVVIADTNAVKTKATNLVEGVYFLN